MAATVSMNDRRAMGNGNQLKIGLFGVNCSSGRTVTMIPERWSGDWPDNLRLARLADDAGIDFMLPIARWKGFGGDTDYQGTTLETLTWASGLLAATRRITVFGTVHAALVPPVFAAKAMATADQIGEGRFALNLVVGWNEGEFDMFGVTLRDHENRYLYAQEWIDAVRKMWGPEDDFDFDGQFIRMKNVRSKPKPFGGSQPLIMNAGASETGRDFALRNFDAIFMGGNRGAPDEMTKRIAYAKDIARSHGRELDVYTTGIVTCRRTRKEAEEFQRYAAVENVDWAAVDAMLAKQRTKVEPADYERLRQRLPNGAGGALMIGDADDVANELATLHRAGLRGIGINMVNYADELPFFADEVLPRLERLGIREPRRPAVARSASTPLAPPARAVPG